MSFLSSPAPEWTGFPVPVLFPDVDPEVLAREDAAEREAGPAPNLRRATRPRTRPVLRRAAAREG